ncbi:MAG TPA: outer membrane protein transport protein [Chitinophagales bacterium]|nr:outer membrane protein transport protein [Chitinophagales bacterium]
MIRRIILLSVLCCLGYSVYGSGFQISLQGQPQIGLAHAGTGITLNAASLFYNPGAMGMLKGKQLMLGLHPITGKARFVQEATGLSGQNEFGISYPFSAYYTQRLGSAANPSPFTIGIGIYTPFGSQITYPNDWMGKYLVQSASLTTVFAQPTISYNVNDRLGVGLSFVVGWGNFNIRRAVPIFDEQTFSNANLQAQGMGVGFTTGIYVEPWDNKLAVGVTYKSSARVKLKNGTADFTVPATAEPLFPDTNFDLNVGLPDAVSLATTYFFNGNQNHILPDKSNAHFITAEVERVGWIVFKDLNFAYAQPVAGATGMKLIRNYQNAYRFSLAGQYAVTPRFTLRAGIYYDLNAAPDCCVTPEVPDGKRVVGTTGASFKLLSNLLLDMSFLYGRSLKRSFNNEQNNFQATFKGYVISPGIGIQYKF